MAVFKMRSPFPRRLTAALYCFFLVLMSIKGQDDNWCTYSNWEEVKKKNTFFGGLVTHQHVVEASRGVSNPMARAFQIIKINEEESQPIAHPFVCSPLNKVTTSRPFFFPFPPESFDVYYLLMGWRNTRPCRKRNFPNDIFKYLHRIDFYKIQQTSRYLNTLFLITSYPATHTPPKKKKGRCPIGYCPSGPRRRSLQASILSATGRLLPDIGLLRAGWFLGRWLLQRPLQRLSELLQRLQSKSTIQQQAVQLSLPVIIRLPIGLSERVRMAPLVFIPPFRGHTSIGKNPNIFVFSFRFFFFFNFEAILDRCQMMSCEHVQLNHTIEWCRSLWPTWTMGGAMATQTWGGISYIFSSLLKANSYVLCRDFDVKPKSAGEKQKTGGW